MMKLGKFQNDLESFADALNSYDVNTHTPGSLLDEDHILRHLNEAVSDFGVEAVLYKGENLLTFLEHEDVETFVFPKKSHSKLKQKIKLLTPKIETTKKSIFYVKSVSELERPKAANQDKDTQQTDGFVTCIFYSENGRKGLVLFSLKGNCPELDEESLLTLQHYGQLAYLKICELVSKREKTIRLTPREREMVKFISKGRSNPEIAEITGLSVHTVNGYLRGIYLKTSTKDRVSLSLYALHQGLLL